jgi:tetratricopeptide (TPR) repeat protein
VLPLRSQAGFSRTQLPGLTFSGHADDRFTGVDVVRTSSRKTLAGAAVILTLICVGVLNGLAPTEAAGQLTRFLPQSNSRTPAATTPNRTQTIDIHGHVITGTHSGPSILEVRFETDGSQIIGFAYANTSGEFFFQKSGITVVSSVYVVVNLEGYAPYRERVINSGPGPGAFDATLSIFLEPAKTFDEAQGGNAPVVDANPPRTKIPGKAIDEYEKAMKEAANGNPAKAVEGLQRAVKIAPDFYDAQQSLGIQYTALQRFQEAEDALVRARNLSPNSGSPLINLGALYFKRGQVQSDAGHSEEAAALYSKAVGFLNEAVRKFPSSAAYSNLGAALYKIGEYERARISLNRALEIDDNEDSASLVLINVYVKLARYDDALEEIGRYLARNPNSPQRASLESIQTQIQKLLKK